mmetsp:Transcript_12898/g.37511  ORF Transcript_12898/g.37511 Transcript_12898/m.37511 type:complete len:324 (-) Transcript_12898:1078-2049(-)
MTSRTRSRTPPCQGRRRSATARSMLDISCTSPETWSIRVYQIAVGVWCGPPAPSERRGEDATTVSSSGAGKDGGEGAAATRVSLRSEGSGGGGEGAAWGAPTVSSSSVPLTTEGVSDVGTCPSDGSPPPVKTGRFSGLSCSGSCLSSCGAVSSSWFLSSSFPAPTSAAFPFFGSSAPSSSTHSSSSSSSTHSSSSSVAASSEGLSGVVVVVAEVALIAATTTRSLAFFDRRFLAFALRRACSFLWSPASISRRRQRWCHSLNPTCRACLATLRSCKEALSSKSNDQGTRLAVSQSRAPKASGAVPDAASRHNWSQAPGWAGSG